MGKRQRKRRRAGDTSVAPAVSSDYRAADGSVLTLRDELSAGTLKGLEELEARPAATAEDRWQRRAEYLFERLAVRWEIAGLPLEDQAELLGRYRMASASGTGAGARGALGAPAHALSRVDRVRLRRGRQPPGPAWPAWLKKVIPRSTFVPGGPAQLCTSTR